MEAETDLTNSSSDTAGAHRRRDLLPWWIKLFTWLFLISGAIAPIAFIIGFLGIDFQLALYGLRTFEPMSYTGLVLLSLFFFKGIAALGLWTEKDWAIEIAQLDAIVGIIVCAYVMASPFLNEQQGFNFNFRLELLLLIPFLIKLNKMKAEWKRLRSH